MTRRNSSKADNRLRIIGGKHRGRKLSFPTIRGLRPTTDQIRETLFNWLAPSIVEARCLDAFAGSGALGLEALSRGAREVLFIDNNREALRALNTSLDLLEQTHATTLLAHALPKPLLTPVSSFDIIFLDPPFDSALLEKSIAWLIEQQLTHLGTQVYLEASRKQSLPKLPTHWEIRREKTIGGVRFCLLECTDANASTEKLSTL